MEQIYANHFSVGMVGDDIHLRIRTLTPMYNEVGRVGNEVAKEVVVIMNPNAYFGLRELLLKAEKQGEEEKAEEKE